MFAGLGGHQAGSKPGSLAAQKNGFVATFPVPHEIRLSRSKNLYTGTCLVKMFELWSTYKYTKSYTMLFSK